MQSSRNQAFLSLLFLSLLIFLLSKFNFLQLPESLLSKATVSATSPILNLSSFFGNLGQNSTENRLKDENLSLQKKLLDQESLINENKALHDQFQTTKIRSLGLLPAKVVGTSQFLPGIFHPDTFIIDKGSSDDVKVGEAVVFKDNLIGKISKTSKFLSEVSLVTNVSLKFAAKTTKGSQGVIRGEGNGDLILDNVLLSDRLNKDDLVITTGDLKLDQTGVPAEIIIGQITAVEGSSSDLFQRAKLKTLIDLSKITELFVFKGLR